MRRFTRQELAFFNGEDGAPAYLAHEGVVYDASGSFLWQRGEHQVQHRAGQDLTGALDQAPHGPDVLVRLPIVGVLADEECQHRLRSTGES
jgi:predicted heme/steroid binding protein